MSAIWTILVGLYEGLNPWVVAGIVALLLVLRLVRAGMLVWTAAWWLAVWVFVEYGFRTPIPASVVKLYMGITSLALFAYVASSPERRREVGRPIERLIVERRFRVLLALLLVALPAAAAYSTYRKTHVPLESPGFARTIHPAPPAEVTVHDQKIDLIRADQPYSAEKVSADEYAAHVASGRTIYYQNCFYCHGDGMAGDGMFAYGLNPIPSNFTDGGVLPNLQSSFVFWRVAKGGPGLPEEGGPWESAMPRWEQFLSIDEMWDVDLFLYEFNDYQPRAREEHTE